MFTTYGVFFECYAILMEGTPADIRVDHIREDIIKIRGVDAIEDFHCWSISGGKNVLTAHIRLSDHDEEVE
jgi:cobalt-zinc-cadmium efflux system protein